ncbi:hypothetical protein DVH05_012921 [Phytophthora capsici]|nr:hypothetical protein DVH05_012921 [Phytophthora capsici]
MKSTPSRSADSFDVFSLDEATPLLNEYLSSIQIDNENPGFVLSWDLDSLTAFVEAANAQNAAHAPGWLRTRPPDMTPNTFTDDLVHVLHHVAGGRCGRVLLAPNTQQQYGAITGTLCVLQTVDFMQNAAQGAFGNTERYLATTSNLTDTKAQRSVPNNLPHPGIVHLAPLRRLFI